MFLILKLFLGDVLVFYFSLFLTLFIRYNFKFISEIKNHFLPFSFLLFFWLLIFYISDLYERKKLKNDSAFYKTVLICLIINFFLTIAIFYFLPFFKITPKVNLFVFILIFAFLFYFWRRKFNLDISKEIEKVKILLIAPKKIYEEIDNFLLFNPQFGYEIGYFLDYEKLPKKQLGDFDDWLKFIQEKKIKILVLPEDFKKNEKVNQIFYRFLINGYLIYDLTNFYEQIFKKIPLKIINEEWFLENKIALEKYYDSIKDFLEFSLSLILFLIFLPIILIIAILIKIESEGPIIYTQKRVGKNNKIFTLFKFRTMIKDAEKDGPKWKESDKSDSRFTKVGKFLARMHLDELPQLINILRGDISFIGPRPERPEFVKILENKIRFYQVRHLIKPGLTGWAQLNYKYTNSIEETEEKLAYDLFYLKNRSLILDLIILIKTLRKFFN